MAGYTRQSSFTNGSVIDASDFEDEYNALQDAFNGSTGHTHDGTAGNGPPIENIGPSSDLVVTASVVRPKTSNVLDIGTPTVQFKNGYFDGQLNTDTLLVDETSEFTGNVTATADVSIGGNLTVTGDATINGNLTFGDAATDSVTFGADIDSSILPNTDDTYDLGSDTKQWRDLYINGTANIDSLVADTADINGGTIDGTVIGDTNPVAITGTTVTATSFVGPLTGSVTGTIKATDGTVIFDNGTDGTDAAFTGDIKANDGTIIISNGADGTDSTFTGDLTGDVSGNVTGNLDGIVGGNTPAAGTFTTVTTSGNAVIGGNLTVSGTTTTVNTETINLADNQIVLNSNYTGSTPTEDGGIEIERGTLINKTLVWNETDDKWTVGAETFVAGTFEGNLSGNAATATKLATSHTVSLTGAVTGSTSFDGSANVSIVTTATADPTLTLAGDATGSATFTNLGNATLTVAVADDSHTHDGRYYTETESDSRFVRTGAASTITSGSLRFNDNIELALGTGSDAEFFVDGSDMYLDLNSGIGNFYIRDGSTTRFTFDDAGSFTATGNITAYSDQRLKSDIVTIPDALEKVKALRGVNFTKDGEASTGVIAQEVQQVMPEVINDSGEYLAVAYGNLVGVLIEAVKELSEEVEALKAK